MTLRCYVGTSAECVTVAGLCDRLFNYPSNGENVGSGAHAPPTVGRTLRYSEMRAHPTLATTFCLPLGTEVASEIARTARLTPGERTQLSNFDGAAQPVTFPEPAL